MNEHVRFWVRISLSLFLVIALCAPTLAAEKLTKVADNVYSYVDVKKASNENSFGGNAGIIIGNDGIIVVDTLMSAKEAQRFIRDIRTVSDKPIRYVVNTHHHFDHSFGNAEFVKLGAVVVAHEKDREEMVKTAPETLKNMGQFGVKPQDMAGTTLAYPTVTFNDRMTIDVGGQVVELIRAGHCHSAGDTLVYLRDKKLLFAGDILFTNYHPFVADGNIEEWVKELGVIAAMDVEKIIPGHGPLSGKKDVEDMKAYIILFDKKATELGAKSRNIPAIANELKKMLPPRAEGNMLILGNLAMKYVKGNK